MPRKPIQKEPGQRDSAKRDEAEPFLVLDEQIGDQQDHAEKHQFQLRSDRAKILQV